MIAAGVEGRAGRVRLATATRRRGRSLLLQAADVASGAAPAVPRPRRVLAALPFARTTHRILELPFSDDATLAQVVPLELRGRLPVDPGDASVGFEVLTRDASGARVLAVLARTRDLTLAAAAAGGLGMTAAGVVPAPLALRALLPARFAGTVVLADGDGSSLTVWDAGRPCALRALAADARHPAALAAEIAWSLGALGAGAGAPLHLAGADASPALVEECRRRHGEATPLPLDHLALEVDAARVLASPVACGLALAALEHVPPLFPLVAPTPLWTPRLRRLVAAAVLLAAFDVGIVRLELARRMARLEAMLRTEAERALPGEPIVAPRAQLEAAAERLSGRGGPGAGSALARLREVSERIPEGLAVDLSRLTLSGERLQLTGHATTFEAVDVLRRALSASPRLRDVAADEVRTAVDGTRIGFQVRGRWGAAGEAPS